MATATITEANVAFTQIRENPNQSIDEGTDLEDQTEHYTTGVDRHQSVQESVEDIGSDREEDDPNKKHQKTPILPKDGVNKITAGMENVHLDANRVSQPAPTPTTQPAFHESNVLNLEPAEPIFPQTVTPARPNTLDVTIPWNQPYYGGATSTPIIYPPVCQPGMGGQIAFAAPPPHMTPQPQMFTPRPIFHARAPTGYTPVPGMGTPRTHFTPQEMIQRGIRPAGALGQTPHEWATSLNALQGLIDEQPVVPMPQPQRPNRNVHWQDQGNDTSSEEWNGDPSVNQGHQDFLNRRHTMVPTPMSSFYASETNPRRRRPEDAHGAASGNVATSGNGGEPNKEEKASYFHKEDGRWYHRGRAPMDGEKKKSIYHGGQWYYRKLDAGEDPTQGAPFDRRTTQLKTKAHNGPQNPVRPSVLSGGGQGFSGPSIPSGQNTGNAGNIGGMPPGHMGGAYGPPPVPPNGPHRPSGGGGGGGDPPGGGGGGGGGGNGPPNPHGNNQASNDPLVNTLLQKIDGQMGLIYAFMNNQNQFQAGRPREDKRVLAKDTFPKLTFGERKHATLTQFVEWRNNVNVVFMKNPWIHQRSIDEQIAAIVDDLGEGRKWALNNFPSDNGSFHIHTMDEFYTRLKYLVCGSAVDTIAEANFEKYRPSPGMVTKHIAIRLRLHWECAFPPQTRQWQTLINKFMRCINDDLSDMLIKSIVPQRGCPPPNEMGFNTYVAWCEEIEGNEILARTLRTVKDNGGRNRQPDQRNKPPGQKNKHGQGQGQGQRNRGGEHHEEKMDMSNLTNKDKSESKTKGDNKTNKRKNKYERAAESAKNFKIKNSDEVKKLMDAGACFKCHQPGHISRDCTNPPKRQGGRRSMNNMETASEDEGDPAGSHDSGVADEDGATMSQMANNARSWTDPELWQSLGHMRMENQDAMDTLEDLQGEMSEWMVEEALAHKDCHLEQKDRGRAKGRNQSTKNVAGPPRRRPAGRPHY